jgi:hypothetical protein
MVTLADAKAHLNLTDDADDALVTRLIATAQQWFESQLGYTLADRYPPTGSPAVSTVPAPIEHGVLMMIAQFYENREASVVGVTAAPIPFGVADIVADWRDYSWGETTDA